MTPRIVKYLGPPGTGKSTTLLNVVESLLSSRVAPEDIVFTTFTRAGAYEARDRACARFNLPPGRFPYFKTLHALCYGFLSQPVMQDSDWGNIARATGLFFSSRLSMEEVVTSGVRTKGDLMRNLWFLSRVRMQLPEETFARRNETILRGPDLTQAEFQHFIQSVMNYKQESGKIDFCDMLELWLKEGPDMTFPYVIVDEAQDLSVLQWAVVQKLIRNAREVYVAGDDDQCIHEWNGATPVPFMDLKASECSVLPQSYRIPSRIQALANKVIGRVSRRLTKEYRPRNEEGDIRLLNDLETYRMNEGTWLLLARNACYIKDYEEICRSRGLLYSIYGYTGEYRDQFLLIIDNWKRLVAGERLAHSEILRMYEFMSQRDRVTRGFKKVLQEANRHQLFSFEDLARDYGLVALRTMHWSSALDMIPEEETTYLKAVETGEGLAARPRIRISTIHSAKGQEADHVVINPNQTLQTNEAMLQNPDPEHRVFYVGVTRARKSLHVMIPTEGRAYQLMTR